MLIREMYGLARAAFCAILLLLNFAMLCSLTFCFCCVSLSILKSDFHFLFLCFSLSAASLALYLRHSTIIHIECYHTSVCIYVDIRCYKSPLASWCFTM